MKNTDWIEKENTRVREFVFKDFIDVIDFVNQVAVIAQEMNHHPDMLIYEYCKLRVTTTTHDVGGITEKDYALAQKIDSI